MHTVTARVQQEGDDMSDESSNSEIALALLVASRGILRLDGGRDTGSNSQLKVEQSLELARLMGMAASRLSVPKLVRKEIQS